MRSELDAVSDVNYSVCTEYCTGPLSLARNQGEGCAVPYTPYGLNIVMELTKSYSWNSHLSTSNLQRPSSWLFITNNARL